MKRRVRELEKYRKARLSAERGMIPLKKGGLVRVCLIFPNTYYAGMSNLAIHTLFAILNSRKDCVCERSFCEEPLTGYSLETGSRLGDFDILAFSLSFELDYPNVLTILAASKIPSASAERNKSHPLVIAGGPCVFSNPEPLADCIDLFAIGEGEELIEDLIDGYLETRDAGSDRAVTLRSLSEIPGVYVPSLYEPVYSENGELMGMESACRSRLPVSARLVQNLDNYPCSSVIVTPKTEFGGMYLIELGRGCRRGCKFCSACHVYLRRSRSLETVIKQIRTAENLSDRIGLVTSDLADYPRNKELLAFLLDRHLGFSVSSVRADAITDELLVGMEESGQRTLTLAPEVAVGRLASLTGKRITAEALLRAVELALEHGIANFRLYFMIGLPGEEDEDVEAIIGLARRVVDRMREEARRSRKMGKLTVSVNPFVPKPFTPLESAPFADSASLSKRVRILREGIPLLGNARVKAESPRMARLQCILARGDRRVYRLTEMIAEGSTVAQAMRAFGDETERFVCAGPRDAGIRPWDTIRPPSTVKQEPGIEKSN